MELEPTLGFEPRTCCLRNSCSTTELCRRRTGSIGEDVRAGQDAEGHPCCGVVIDPRRQEPLQLCGSSPSRCASAASSTWVRGGPSQTCCSSQETSIDGLELAIAASHARSTRYASPVAVAVASQ